MGKEGRYNFDSGSTDALGDDNSEELEGQPTEEETKRGSQEEEKMQNTKQSVGTSATGTETETATEEDETAPNKEAESETSLPPAGKAGDLRTGETHHTIPEEFSMSNLPIKQRRSNVKEYRDVDLTVTIQQETMDDIRGAKRALEDEFNGEVPKTDVYEIVLIAGANDDLSLLDAAHIVGYGIE
ncbi:hypothetical protein ACFQL1_24390 [Halomicroarcula sp. GCM10025709]|uniref:hypothetical protein n=1 Tax=Halomicroarcula sp. GCM10025709 TaxID=3252669 RepID=UPI0036109E32